MATKYDNVIVFGPTGAVGGAVALEASKRGAKVWLAMRDTSKAINEITAEQEQDGKFVRVQADLSDPELVKQAIRTSGAKAAYVYMVHAPGGMKSSLEAMKEAGIEYVVLLSSFTIKPDENLREIPPAAAIPYGHAQGEVALEDIGMAHTALRPASFASNPFNMSMDASKTPCELYVYSKGTRTVDNIVQRDIGRVGGAVLVDRPSTSSKEIIYLYGPTLRTELETCNIIKNVSPKEIKIIQQTPEEWAGRMRTKGIPQHIIQYLIDAQESSDQSLYSGSFPQQGTANIKKYSGYEPTSLEEFVKYRTKE